MRTWWHARKTASALGAQENRRAASGESDDTLNGAPAVKLAHAPLPSGSGFATAAASSALAFSAGNRSVKPAVSSTPRRGTATCAAAVAAAGASSPEAREARTRSAELRHGRAAAHLAELPARATLPDSWHVTSAPQAVAGILASRR